MITYVFPGQGAQKKGMGQELFDEFPEFVEIADRVLGYSIKELCLEDPEKKLGLTQYTQPALFIVNALTYLKKIKDTGIKPDFVAGHSLGEYNALFAAKAFDFETGVRLVKKRGELMGYANGGGMAAIIGLTGDEVKTVIEKEGLDKIDIANLNSPRQIVISGPKEEVLRVKPIFEKQENVRMVSVLNVSGAFHSRYMRAAGVEFENFIQGMNFSDLEIPVIANVNARPYRNEDIKKNLVEQISNSVHWTDSIRYLMGREDMDFEEIGVGKVLTGMIARIKKEATPIFDVPEEVHTSESAAKAKIYTASSLGSEAFKQRYHLKYAYVAGAMYRGVASKELVVKIGKSGMLGFLGTGGLSIDEIERNIQYIQSELSNGETFGCNFLHNANDAQKEEDLALLYLRKQIRVIEASAFLGITPALILYKAKGLSEAEDGSIICANKIIAKFSRPEVAEAFLSPAPERMVKKLVDENKISLKEAKMLENIPMADDLCVESDSGGHTDRGVAFTLIPSIRRLQREMKEKYNYKQYIGVGAAGGIGTPEAAAASFLLGADFIVTGSINQCSVEAGTSDTVKDMLENINVQDTDYAPAGDMFEYGAKVQVLKKGVFFPARANKLYDLYRQYNSIDEIDEKTRNQIQEKYFKRSFDSIFEELKQHYSRDVIEDAQSNPKRKMALIFKWYFHYSSKLALSGNPEGKVTYQVHCGPALGAFNQWVKGTNLENWRNRHVDEMGLKLLDATAEYLNDFTKKDC